MFLAGLIGSVVLVISSIFHLRKNKSPVMIKLFILSWIFIAIAAASWIFNPGWYRFLLTIVSVPFIHSTVFLYITTLAGKYICQSKSMKIYTMIYYITYIISYLFFADGGDYGPMYVFFGLIHNNEIASSMMGIAIDAFLANIVFMIMMIVKMIILKKAVVTELCEIEE